MTHTHAKHRDRSTYDKYTRHDEEQSRRNTAHDEQLETLSTDADVTPDLRAALTTMTQWLGAVAFALGSALPTSSTSVIGQSADPKFDTWDGNAYTLQSWIRAATESVTLRGTSDAAAIRHARLKLG